MNVKILVVLSLFALLLPVNALIPSEGAIDAASVYLRQGEQASIVNRPFQVDGKQYFVVYFHPQTSQETKNLVVVIDAETGLLIEDEKILKKVYLFDSKLSFLQKFVSENKISFQDLKTAVESGKNKREQADNSLQNVETSLAKFDENIAQVQNSFSQFSLSMERLDEEIVDGSEMQDLFERDYSNTAFEGLITRYNSTFKTLLTTLKAGEDYQKIVINKSNELTQKGIDQNSFKPGLQTAFDIGLDRFSSRTSLENAVEEFSFLASQQLERQVNDSVQSYLYRKNSVDSDNAVEKIKPSVEDILRKIGEVQECTSTTFLEKTWQNTLKAQSANEFTFVKGNVTLVENELDKVKTALEKCSGQQATPQNQRDNTDIFIGVVLLLLVGYLVWRFMGKKKETQIETPSAKGSLFGQ